MRYAAAVHIAWVHAPLLAAALLVAAGASGQTIYRCGPDGRSYSQQPCPEGRAVEAADPRTEAQRRDGEHAAAADRRLARDLADERRMREREAAARGTAAAGILRPKPAALGDPPHRVGDKKKPKPRKAGKTKTGGAPDEVAAADRAASPRLAPARPPAR